MNTDWEAKLRALQASQADLRLRMESLDRQIATLSAKMAEPQGEPEPAKAPVLPPVADIVLPAPQPAPALRPPPLPVDRIPERKPEPVKTPEIPARPPTASGLDHAPAENLELKVGKYWLVRIGILVMLTGLVLLGNLAYHTFVTKLGAPGKLALLYLAGGLLAGIGLWLERKMKGMRKYGRVLLAGGAATIYYTTYAAHFVDRLRVISSPVVGGVLLLFLAGGLTWLAERRRSQGMAFAAVLLSYYTSAINPATNFTLFSNVLLTAVAVFLLVRHRWFNVSWLALVGSYGSFAYWSVAQAAAWRGGSGGGDFWTANGFLFAYWLIFTLAVFWRKAELLSAAHRAIFLTANNAAFFLLATPGVLRWYRPEFWVFPTVYGLVLLGLAAVARRLKREDLSFDGTYLAQGLIALTLGIVTKFSGYQLALILAVESTALLFCSRFRHRVLLQIGSGLAAVGAFFLAWNAMEVTSSHGWTTALTVGLLLLLNAWVFKQIAGTLAAFKWEWKAAGYSVLGLLLCGLVLKEKFVGTGEISAFAIAAVGLTVLLRLHRLPEVTLTAQGFLAVACAETLVRSGVGTSWTHFLPALAGAVFLMHWWQRQRILDIAVGKVVECADALAICVLILRWLAPDIAGDFDVPGTGNWFGIVAAGLVLLAYGLLTRAWFLTALSQAFTFFGTFLCLRAMYEGAPPWPWTLAAVAMVGVQPILLSLFAPREAREPLRHYLMAYRAAVGFFAAIWVIDTIPSSYRCLFFTVLGGLVFLPAAVKKNAEYLWHAAGLLAIALMSYAVGVTSGRPVTGADFVALLLILGLQQSGKILLRGTSMFPAEVQNFVSVATILGLWVQVSRWAWTGERGLVVTIVWALLAFATLGAGFVLRERAYRLMGLLILGVAVGHVFFVDVWKMGQFAGIMGILGLAVVLLLLGFIYNRFAEQIKKWL